MTTLNYNFFVAQEDEDLYNIFAVDDFDEDGYYNGHNGEEGYHIDDFYIVFKCNTFTEACAWVDEQF